MAKTGDTPDRKPKARARAKRPSFAPVATPAASSAWVYRSDAAAPKVAANAKAPDQVAPTAGPGRVTQTLDIVTLPIAVSLMAAMVPMRWLLGPRH